MNRVLECRADDEDNRSAAMRLKSTGVLLRVCKKQMYKVVFILKQIVLRLKECEVDLVVKKNNITVPLCTRVKIANGFGSTNATTQFYLHPKDPTLHFQLIISLGKDKKMGGEVKLKISEWEPNVLHNNISQLLNSPDKQGRLAFAFYYFADEEVVDTRPIFLANDRHKLMYQNILHQKALLTSENLLLEKEKANEQARRQLLNQNKKRMEEERHHGDESHRKFMEYENHSIEDSNKEFQKSKSTYQKLTELLRENGMKMEKQY